MIWGQKNHSSQSPQAADNLFVLTNYIQHSGRGSSESGTVGTSRGGEELKEVKGLGV